jgi:hypothetical protein
LATLRQAIGVSGQPLRIAVAIDNERTDSYPVRVLRRGGPHSFTGGVDAVRRQSRLWLDTGRDHA